MKYILKKWESLQTVLNQTHYKKTVNIVAIFATSRKVTFSRLITHCCYRHNVRRFAMTVSFHITPSFLLAVI